MTNKPRFLYFRSNSCAPCSVFQNTLDKYSALSNAQEVRVITIEADEGFEWTSLYKIKTVPSLVILDEHGVEVQRFEGCSKLSLEKLVSLNWMRLVDVDK